MINLKIQMNIFIYALKAVQKLVILNLILHYKPMLHQKILYSQQMNLIKKFRVSSILFRKRSLTLIQLNHKWLMIKQNQWFKLTLKEIFNLIQRCRIFFIKENIRKIKINRTMLEYKINQNSRDRKGKQKKCFLITE